MRLADETKRNTRIGCVEKGIRDGQSDGREIDWEKFWVYVADVYKVSERTAKEYIKIARSRIK